MESGPPKDVLDAQVQQGFAFVSQGCCEALLLSKGKSVPPGEEEDVDRKTQLALACIAAIKPDMKSEEVAQKINQGYLLEGTKWRQWRLCIKRGCTRRIGLGTPRPLISRNLPRTLSSGE